MGLRRMALFLCVCAALMAHAIAQHADQIFDCLTDHKNVECQTFYNKSVHSCYDYLLAGQRKSGQYPFLKEVNGGKPIQWLRCEFDELIDNVTTVVHNALESYDVQAGRHFELIRAGVQAQAWHIEYELEHEMIRRLVDASGQCRQEVKFKDCSSYENLRSAFKNRSAVLLSAEGYNLTEESIRSQCKGGSSFHAMNLTTAVVSLGAKGHSDPTTHVVRLSLGPLYCRGRGTKTRQRCIYSFPATERPIAVPEREAGQEVSFHFRTLSKDTPLVNIRLNGNQWLNISIAKGWIFTLSGHINNETLTPSLVSDGYWHTLQVKRRDAELLVNIDTLILIWKVSLPSLSAVHLDSKSIICIQDLLINDRLHCSQNTTSNGQKTRSFCESKFCNPTDFGPCTPQSGCQCRCADGASECSRFTDNDHAVTFPENGDLHIGVGSSFVWVDETRPDFSTSFHFRTRKASGLLAFVGRADWSAQIALVNGSLTAHLCREIHNVDAPVHLSCRWCTISRRGGFDDYSWHYVSLEDLPVRNQSYRQIYLLSPSGACQLLPFTEISSLVPNKIYIPKPNSAPRHLTYFGGVPEERHLKKEGRLMQNNYATFLTRGPEHFVGCLSFPGAARHVKQSRDETWASSFTVTEGCADQDPCQACGKYVPCVGSGQSMYCNCSGAGGGSLLVQDSLKWPGQCRTPKLVTPNLMGVCIVTQEVPFYFPHLTGGSRLEFSLLWFSFQIVASGPIKPVRMNSLAHRPGLSQMLTIDIQSSSTFDLKADSANGKVQLLIPPSFVNASREHIFLLRRLSRDTFELQVNSKRVTLGSPSIIDWVDRDYAVDFANSLCVSHFVIQYKNQDGERPMIIELDNVFNVTGVPYVQHPTVATDFSVLESDTPSLRLLDTPYPPNPMVKPARQTGTNGGFPYWWIIVVVIVAILLLVTILGVVIYFTRHRRHRSHAIPTVDPDERYRTRRHSDDEDEPGSKKTAGIRRGHQLGKSSLSPTFLLPKTKNEARAPPGGASAIATSSARSRAPAIDEDDTGSLHSLNYSLSLDDPSLTLTYDSPPPELHVFAAASALQSPKPKATLCRFNEFSDIL